MLHFVWTRLQVFFSFRRGKFATLLLAILLLLAVFAEFWVGSRALYVSYQGKSYFPVVQGFFPATEFGGTEQFEADYRSLQQQFAEANDGNWLILPWSPYNPYESDFDPNLGSPPYSPSARHVLGTDTLGRDILARLVYAFRITFVFSLALYCLNTLTGIVLGCLMGFFGGWFDLGFQRVIEIWSNLPLIYLLMILASILTPSITSLLLVFAFFNWTGIAWLMRAEILREKQKTYAISARALGLSRMQVLFQHLLPNSLVPIIVNLPFAIVGGISVLTSLDFLGYGLPVPTPSWGEMLKQGQQTFDFAPWIVLSPSVATIITLLLFTFIGEDLRSSFDPRSYNYYK